MTVLISTVLEDSRLLAILFVQITPFVVAMQVAFMTHDNAMMYIKYYLAKYNMQLRQKWSSLL